MRPSIVFGPEDDFFNHVSPKWRRFSPFLPLIGGGKTRFQPVHVADVADAIAAAVDSEEARGKTYELGGPKTLYIQGIDAVHRENGGPKALAGAIAIFGRPARRLHYGLCFPPMAIFRPPITGDQVEMLKTDNIVHTDGDVGTIEDLGVKPLETIEAIVPQYLWRYRSAGQFHIHEEDEVSRVDV